jgi:protein O-mannosyl-transferase
MKGKLSCSRRDIVLTSPMNYHPRKPDTIRLILTAIALLAVIISVYFQAGDHQFLAFDDDVYVTDNQHVNSGISTENAVWAFTSVEAANYHPITWLSHMADVELYGTNPCGHHLTNVFIHAISSVVLLLLLFRITGSLGKSALVAALFGLHPLHVESVAWVAERKDVLSALFFFLTLLLYSEFLARRKPALYLACLCFFVLGLLSKPMLVTLPLVMLLLDFWPFARYRNQEQGPYRHPEQQPCQGREEASLPLRSTVQSLITEKIPFFFCALLSGVVTIYAQHMGGATKSLEVVPLIPRFENALLAYVKYLIKTLWPQDLAVLYPITTSFSLVQVSGALCALLLITALAVRARHRQPYLAFGWFWYLVTLAPVIGVLQVGNQSMADRYSHLPLVGVFVMIAWGIPALAKNLPGRTGILTLLASAVVVACACLTWHQLGYWRDSNTLFRHTLEVTNGNYIIHDNLGSVLAKSGDPEGAIRQFSTALRMRPDFAHAHYNLGVVLAVQGNLEGGIREFRRTLEINPYDKNAHNNLGVALSNQGDQQAAMNEYRSALRLDHDYGDAHFNLGIVLLQKGELDAAMGEFREVLRLAPGNALAKRKLEEVLRRKGSPLP